MWLIVPLTLITLIILSRTRFEIREDIEINASTYKVWATIIDFENYKN